MYFCFRLAASLIAALRHPVSGPRISETWNSYWVSSPTGGRFPVKIKTKKSDGEILSEKVYRLFATFNKAGERPGGQGFYKIDHMEMRIHLKTQQELENEVEKIYILDLVICDKEEDVEIVPRPTKIWRVMGTKEKGVIYGYDPEQKPEVRISAIISEIVASFPVKVAAVGVEPVESSANTTHWPKYEIKGADALYDRRKNRNSVGFLEVVHTTKGRRSWFYCNLKDCDEAVSSEANVLIAEEGKLVVQDSKGERIAFER